MRGFGKPIHKQQRARLVRYWLNLCYSEDHQEWVGIYQRDWQEFPGDLLGLERNDQAARFRAIEYYGMLDPCPESAYLFPGNTDPDDPQFKDVLDHFQDRPFEAMGDRAIQIDLEDLQQRMKAAMYNAARRR